MNEPRIRFQIGQVDELERTPAGVQLLSLDNAVRVTFAGNGKVPSLLYINGTEIFYATANACTVYTIGNGFTKMEGVFDVGKSHNISYIIEKLIQ